MDSIPFNVCSTTTWRNGSLVPSSGNGDTSVTLCPLSTSARSKGLKPKKWLLPSVGKKAKILDGFAGGSCRSPDACSPLDSACRCRKMVHLKCFTKDYFRVLTVMPRSVATTSKTATDVFMIDAS